MVRRSRAPAIALNRYLRLTIVVVSPRQRNTYWAKQISRNRAERPHHRSTDLGHVFARLLTERERLFGLVVPAELQGNLAAAWEHISIPFTRRDVAICIIQAIPDGERDRYRLADLVHARIHATREEIARSLEGN
jgi:hypothetical protein